MGCVGIDLESLAQRSYGGKCGSRRQLPGYDGLLGRVDHLIVDGNARGERDSERDHNCTMLRSTLECKRNPQLCGVPVQRAGSCRLRKVFGDKTPAGVL